MVSKSKYKAFIFNDQVYCDSDSFKQRQSNVAHGGPRDGSSGPSVDGEDDKPAAGSPASFTNRVERLAFLSGLSDDKRYEAAFKMLKGRLKFEDVDGLPGWASWSFGDLYLPATFYSVDGLDLVGTAIENVASSLDSIPPGLVLAFGLALRAFATARELQSAPDRPAGLPDWIRVTAASNFAEDRILTIAERTV